MESNLQRIVLLMILWLIPVQGWARRSWGDQINELGKKCKDGITRACDDLVKMAQHEDNVAVRRTEFNFILDGLGSQCERGIARSCTQLFGITESDQDVDIRHRAFNLINDEVELTKLAITSQDLSMQSAAVHKVSSDEALTKIALECPDSNVGKIAVQRIDNPTTLKQIAVQGHNASVRALATSKMADRPGLETLAGDPNPEIHAAARLRLAELTKSAEHESAQKALLNAIMLGDDRTVDDLLKNRTDLSDTGYVQAAVERGRPTLVRLLLSKGASFNADELLRLAGNNRQLEILDILLESGAKYASSWSPSNVGESPAEVCRNYLSNRFQNLTPFAERAQMTVHFNSYSQAQDINSSFQVYFIGRSAIQGQKVPLVKCNVAMDSRFLSVKEVKSCPPLDDYQCRP